MCQFNLHQKIINAISVPEIETITLASCVKKSSLRRIFVISKYFLYRYGSLKEQLTRQHAANAAIFLRRGLDGF